MESRTRQVYICQGGPEGLIQQVTYSEYRSYWRLLGWELLGPATYLPLFEGLIGHDRLAEGRQPVLPGGW